MHLVSCPNQLAARLARVATRLSYEPGPLLLDFPEYLDLSVAARSQFLFFNEEEYKAALTYTGYGEPRDFIGDSSQILVVTYGENGSEIYKSVSNNEIGHIHIDAIPTESIDYIGAGDSYKAGFLAGFIRGKPLEICGTIGSYMVSECIKSPGGIIPVNKLAQIRTRFGL